MKWRMNGVPQCKGCNLGARQLHYWRNCKAVCLSRVALLDESQVEREKKNEADRETRNWAADSALHLSNSYWTIYRGALSSIYDQDYY